MLASFQSHHLLHAPRIGLGLFLSFSWDVTLRAMFSVCLIHILPRERGRYLAAQNDVKVAPVTLLVPLYESSP